MVGQRNVGPAISTDARIRDLAVFSTGMSFTIADARGHGQPLVWVNPAFTATTGYSFDESVGRNCRFLQGPGTDPLGPAQIRAALESRGEITVTLLNYRKDGSAFWNELTISPMLDAAGELTHFVGIQADVTARVDISSSRDRALDAERAAVQLADTARGRLALLAEASSELAISLDVDETLQRLADLVVPALADWVVIHRADESGVLHLSPIVRDGGGRQDLAREYAALVPDAMTVDSPVRELWRGRPSWLVAEFDPREAEVWTVGREIRELRAKLGISSMMFVALPGRDRMVGSMVLNRGAGRARFTDDDLQVAIDLGRRAGLTVDSARLYQSEHRIAETLQRSLLPDLPRIDGLDIAARYRAAANGAQVGGDFYDVLALPDGAVAVVIGDVVGHDLAAAAAMGHLRGLLRAVAWDSPEAADREPGAVLDRLDRVVQGLVVPLTTLAYARFERATDGGFRTLRHSSAGHPPLLVRDSEGSARFIVAEPGLLLGVRPTKRHTSTERIAAGSTVLAFTDGLVERRGEDLDAGLERLRSVVESAPVGHSADQLCEFVIERLNVGDDDTALLAIRT